MNRATFNLKMERLRLRQRCGKMLKAPSHNSVIFQKCITRVEEINDLLADVSEEEVEASTATILDGDKMAQ